MSRTINLIVIHCAASPNGKVLGAASRTAAAVIDQWHAQRGFHRQPAAVAAYNPDLKAIGYHFILDVDGTKSTGRAQDEIGAHVAGHNANSIGICMVGTDQYSTAQWGALASLVAEAVTYKKALKALDDYQAQRLKQETTYGNQVKAIKAGQLETLAVALAKEQKLYDKANEQLQAAVADRKKHQDAWANNKAVDPAAKAAEPQGVTDYYESLRKANELARKAATSQQTAGNTGLDSDFQKAARDASAAETAFSRVMEVINQLRTGGKITEGEFNFMNDQAGRAQDSADAGMEKTAKSTMQKAMEQIEAIKAAAAAVQKLDISVSINDQQALQDMDSMMNRIQQAATAKPIRIAVELVGPDGKYRTEARSALGLADRPLSEIQSNAEGGAISGPGTGTSDSILSWLSNGEFVVKAAATSYYGPGLLQAINQMRLPRFAVGGAVGQLPAVSRAMSSMPSLQPSSSNAGMNQSGSPINLWLPGASDPITVQAPDTSVKQLRDAALKHNLKFGK